MTIVQLKRRARADYLFQFGINYFISSSYYKIPSFPRPVELDDDQRGGFLLQLVY